MFKSPHSDQHEKDRNPKCLQGVAVFPIISIPIICHDKSGQKGSLKDTLGVTKRVTEIKRNSPLEMYQEAGCLSSLF